MADNGKIVTTQDGARHWGPFNIETRYEVRDFS